MLSDARPLFEGLPASYADPLALAAQQAPGTSSIIVVSYVTADSEYAALPPSSSPRSQPEHRSPNHPQPRPTTPPPHHLTTPTYDLYACRGGQVVSVARTTPDFRFPIMPAVALRRFVEARDKGEETRVSLYEVTDALLRCWLETVYLAPCLKVHVRGAEDAPLVASQLEASACQSGVLEVNDFTDALRPRIKLVHVDSVPKVGFLAAQLSLNRGRVLLYDRARNTAIARARAGEALDLEAALHQADRLAASRRPASEKAARHAQRAFQRQAEHVQASGDEAHLQQYFTSNAEHPRRVQTEHPSAQALSELLVAPAQDNAHGDAHDALALLLASWDAPTDEPTTGQAPTDDERATGPVAEPRDAPQAETDALLQSEADDVAPAQPFQPAEVQPHPDSPEPSSLLHDAPNPSALDTLPTPEADLTRLTQSIRTRFQDALGTEREEALATHAAMTASTALPPASHQVADFLRVYLTGDPPKRWYGFKGQRKRLYAPIADDIRALFDAHRHQRHAAIDALPALWARLQR